MMRKSACLSLLVLALLASCGSSPKVSSKKSWDIYKAPQKTDKPEKSYIPERKYKIEIPTVDSAPSYENTQIGIASWYGIEEHDKFAADGERFSKFDYTAAHKTLPMGTIVRVTNLENGKDIVLKINDRGPFVEGRIIDLSYTAAQSIGLIRNGTAKVMVEVISSPLRQADFFDGRYTIQVGSFAEERNALGLRDRLSTSLSDVRVEPIKLSTGTHYRVRIGRFADKSDADNVASELREIYGYKGRILLE